MQPFEVAERAADIGAEVLVRAFQHGFETRGKAGARGFNSHELVTDADLESQKAIVDAIRAAFPSHEILAEEDHPADVTADHLWIVDPLDGTNNFAHGIPHWAISIAYYEFGKPVCGVVYNPIRHDRYTAQAGQGALHNGNPIHVCPAESLTEVIIAAGFYYDRGAMMEATLATIGDLFRARIHGFRRFGTAALDLCQLAHGWYGGYFEFELSPWDFAAGRLIAEEAGARVTDCAGGPLPLKKSSILAAAPQLHDALLAHISPHFLPLAKTPKE